MASTYELVKDYNGPDLMISMAPIAVIAIIRWSHPFVFDRINKKSDSSIDAYEERLEVLVVLSDINSLDVVNSKDSHISNFSAVLRDNAINYLSAIFPDDWAMVWILPNETRAKSLIERINSGEQCNEFYDGLKFLGRINSIFKDTMVDDAGRPISVFNLNGQGFSEFDYPLFWEPKLVGSDSLPVWYQRVGLELNAIITGSDKSVTKDQDPHAIDVNKMIPKLVRLTMGSGPFPDGNNLQGPAGPASPNQGIRVPSLVGTLLGMTNTEELNYSDILDIVVGVQKFSGNGASTDPDIFQPNGLRQADTQPPEFSSGLFTPPAKSFESQSTPSSAEYQTTGIPLLGEFPLVQLPFQDTPIWQILEQFKNPAVNEMYVSLKPDEFGDVFPRLTVRQLPFSSQKFAVSGAPSGLEVTTFLELPRWNIDPKMLKRIQVGRSNALRCNFWHIQGVGPGTAISPALQYVFSPPNSDTNDIGRSGLRQMTQTVNCLITDAVKGPNIWRDIITDITAGLQLSLTGTIQTVGIIPPIAPGDNVQFANVVYHVESVQHSYAISPDGKRSWMTSLQVSHGMADEATLATNQQDSDLDAPLQEYAGVRNGDYATIRVGRTVLDNGLGVSK